MYNYFTSFSVSTRSHHYFFIAAICYSSLFFCWWNFQNVVSLVMPGAFCKDYTIFTSCPVFCSWVSSYICFVSIYSHCICNELSDSSIFIPMFFRMFFLIVLKSVIFLLYLPLLRLLSYVFLIPIFAAYHLEQTCFCWSSIISLPFLSRPGHIIIFSYSKFQGDVCWYFVPYAIHIFCCHTAQLLTKYGTLFHNLMHCNTVCYSYRSFLSQCLIICLFHIICILRPPLFQLSIILPNNHLATICQNIYIHMQNSKIFFCLIFYYCILLISSWSCCLSFHNLFILHIDAHLCLLFLLSLNQLHFIIICLTWWLGKYRFYYPLVVLSLFM